MTTRKTFRIKAGVRTRAVLADAIAQYARAAYPPGCSDCGQMAREVLMTTAKDVIGVNDEVDISSRQRSMVREAVRWYFDNLDGFAQEERKHMADTMLQVLKGNEVDETAFSIPDPIK